MPDQVRHDEIKDEFYFETVNIYSWFEDTLFFNTFFIMKGYQMITKMLVGFDASEESYKAFDFALDMAASHKSEPEILVLSVIRPPEGMNLVDTDSLLDEAAQEFKTELAGLTEKAKSANLKISTDVAVGHPADTIVRYAEEKGCSLIIVGHKGRSKLGGLLLGSVSRHIASLAGCTVVIVR